MKRDTTLLVYLFVPKFIKSSSLVTGVAKHQNFKLVDDEPPNNTDVEATLQKLKDNDPETKEIILNNIKVSNRSRTKSDQKSADVH